MEELTKYIGSLFGFEGKYKNSMTYPGSVSRRCPDLNKAKLELEYKPYISWKEGVRKTVEWYKDFFSNPNNIYPDGFEPPEKFIHKETS